MKTRSEIQRRLSALETIQGSPLVILTRRFTEEPVAIVAQRGTWERLAGESVEALRKRAMDDASNWPTGVYVLREVGATGVRSHFNPA